MCIYSTLQQEMIIYTSKHRRLIKISYPITNGTTTGQTAGLIADRPVKTCPAVVEVEADLDLAVGVVVAKDEIEGQIVDEDHLGGKY